MKNEKSADKSAKIIWNYLLLKQKLQKADVIPVFCSIDLQIAAYAADLFLDGWAPYILFSGGDTHNRDLLKTSWKGTEARKFAEVAIEKGVSKSRILIENKARNTSENILCSYNILKKTGAQFRKAIVVQKPYMTRRVASALVKQWPDKKTKFVVVSPAIKFEDYYSNKKDKEKIINIMVGDLQRMMIYPKMGYQVQEKIPAIVVDAYKKLVCMGYTKHQLEYIKQ